MPCFHYDPSGDYAHTLNRSVDAWKTNEIVQIPADHIPAGVHSSDLLADAAADWIREQDGDQPWMAYVSFLAPHDPRTMPPEFLEMYPPEEVELTPNFMGGHPYDTGALHIRDEKLEAFPCTPDAIRVPLILGGPGVEQGRQVDAPVYLLDIFPSLCDHLGLDIPPSVEGRSFAPLLNGGEAETRDRLYFAYESTLRPVKKGAYKLTWAEVPERASVVRLFNLEADPWELTDLSSCPDHQTLRNELETDLRELAEEWDDRNTRWGQAFWGRSSCNFWPVITGATA